MQFSTLALSPLLLRAITDEGYEIPTPIQIRAIPPALEGRDILGCAQTGTGKTAAFALPILHRMLALPTDKARRGPALPRALILSPTRELATQIGDSFATYGRHTGLTHTVIFGGVSQFHQVRALHRGVDILVATPGRLIDLMEQGLTNFTNVNTFVLDEADRMLDMGFIFPIRKIAAALPTTRQTMLFSATMPTEIKKLAESMLRDPVRVAVTPVASTVPLIEQSVYMVSRSTKPALLEALIAKDKIARALVFTRTKHGADKVMRRLKQAGISTDSIHGNKSQGQRQRALDSFRTGRCHVLVATDVAARGIDVDNITHVFNYDLPNEPEAYVHRIGRTGRAGATGLAISFCDQDERGFLRDIERLTNQRIPSIVKLPPLPVSTAAPEADRDESHYGHRQNTGPSRGGAARGGASRGGGSSHRGYGPRDHGTQESATHRGGGHRDNAPAHREPARQGAPRPAHGYAGTGAAATTTGPARQSTGHGSPRTQSPGQGAPTTQHASGAPNGVRPIVRSARGPQSSNRRGSGNWG